MTVGRRYFLMALAVVASGCTENAPSSTAGSANAATVEAGEVLRIPIPGGVLMSEAMYLAERDGSSWSLTYALFPAAGGRAARAVARDPDQVVVPGEMKRPGFRRGSVVCVYAGSAEMV